MRINAFQTFGKQTVQPWFSTAFILLRVALGIQFLMAGVQKMGDWSAEGFLMGATGPFAEQFHAMAGSAVVDALNVWGLTLIGVCLILGLFVRPASLFGAVLMALYYLAGFEENTAHGLIDFHIVYIIIFVAFMAGGAGYMLGLDALVQARMKHASRWLKWMVG